MLQDQLKKKKLNYVTKIILIIQALVLLMTVLLLLLTLKMTGQIILQLKSLIRFGILMHKIILNTGVKLEKVGLMKSYIYLDQVLLLVLMTILLRQYAEKKQVLEVITQHLKMIMFLFKGFLLINLAQVFLVQHIMKKIKINLSQQELIMVLEQFNLLLKLFLMEHMHRFHDLFLFMLKILLKIEKKYKSLLSFIQKMQLILCKMQDIFLYLVLNMKKNLKSYLTF